MSGGAPLDEVDGYSVTISDHDNIMTLQLTSSVRGMHVLENTQADRDSGIVGQDTENSVTGKSPLTQRDRCLILGAPYRHTCTCRMWTTLASLVDAYLLEALVCGVCFSKRLYTIQWLYQRATGEVNVPE